MIERNLWADPAAVPAAAAPPPERCDVAVVGAGYTGLSAARALARRGASVVVLERHEVGWGASGRNGGFVLPGHNPDADVLARRLGDDTARRMFRSSLDAQDHLESLIAGEAIACDYARCGALALAAKPDHLPALAETARWLRSAMGHETVELGAADLGAEIGSRRYHGGLLDPRGASLHPGTYVRGLGAAAARAGAAIVTGVDVRGVAHRAGRTELTTSRGPVSAGAVMVATNGYTGAAFPSLRRRVVPVGSYLIATAPLEPSLAARLIPRNRVLYDTKNLLYYFRLSPDGRMVFGGRAAFTPLSVARAARLLARAMAEVFPDLAGVPLECAWGGQVGFARDQLPHAGRMDGLHYAMAYGGHGVALSTWLGHLMGEALAGAGPWPEPMTPFRAVPAYRGRPWFLPLAGAYYWVKDLL